MEHALLRVWELSETQFLVVELDNRVDFSASFQGQGVHIVDGLQVANALRNINIYSGVCFFAQLQVKIIGIVSYLVY